MSKLYWTPCDLERPHLHSHSRREGVRGYLAWFSCTYYISVLSLRQQHVVELCDPPLDVRH